MKKFGCLITFVSFLVLFCSCGNSVDDMLENYNSKFTETVIKVYIKPPEEDRILSPGDEGFKPSLMLRSEYYVWEDSTLNLAAPYNCVAYLWEMFDPENDNIQLYEQTGGFLTMTGTTDRSFIMYLPDSLLEFGHTYTLKLTVKSVDGDIFTDSCGIIVYRHFNYDET